MRSLIQKLVATTVALALLGGCANFDTIRAFAKDGSAVAAAAKKDVDVFSTSCAELTVEQRVLEYARGATPPDKNPSKTCQQAAGAISMAAESISVQLLVKYHATLNSLAGDENWTLSKEIETLGKSVKDVKADGKALTSGEDVEKYQKAFTAIADMLVSALREREAKRLLQQEFDWPRVLQPLKFWYGGADGNTVSLYSTACEIVKTDWKIVQSELQDYARCDRNNPGTAIPCEPLTAGTRMVANEAKFRTIAACAPGTDKTLPPSARARVELIDSWIAANDELRRKAFEKDIGTLDARLAVLREQVDAIRDAF